LTISESLIVDVVALRRHVGTKSPVAAVVNVGDASVGDSSVVDCAVEADVIVESTLGGVSVSGSVSAEWSAPCRRCLTPLTGRMHADMAEIFEDEPTDGESWPIVEERIDLVPAMREAVILALPLAPLCEESCRGPEPERFPTGPPDEGETLADPRWAALDQLSFNDE